jgi:hypothetical protein
MINGATRIRIRTVRLARDGGDEPNRSEDFGMTHDLSIDDIIVL